MNNSLKYLCNNIQVHIQICTNSNQNLDYYFFPKKPLYKSVMSSEAHMKRACLESATALQNLNKLMYPAGWLPDSIDQSACRSGGRGSFCSGRNARPWPWPRAASSPLPPAPGLHGLATNGSFPRSHSIHTSPLARSAPASRRRNDSILNLEEMSLEPARVRAACRRWESERGREEKMNWQRDRVVHLNSNLAHVHDRKSMRRRILNFMY
jgi:hypothetical protein